MRVSERILIVKSEFPFMTYIGAGMFNLIQIKLIYTSGALPQID